MRLHGKGEEIQRYEIDFPVVFALARHGLHLNYEPSIERQSWVEEPEKILRLFAHPA